MTDSVARLLGIPDDAGATVEILTAVEGAVMAWRLGSGGACPRCGSRSAYSSTILVAYCLTAQPVHLIAGITLTGTNPR